jgi:hypothetical protein
MQPCGQNDCAGFLDSGCIGVQALDEKFTVPRKINGQRDVADAQQTRTISPIFGGVAACATGIRTSKIPNINNIIFIILPPPTSSRA